MKIRCVSSGMGINVGDLFHVIRDSTSYWVIIFSGSEKRVIKKTRLFAGAPNGGPSFELVTVTETQLDLIPSKRGPGRPSTGKALTPAEKQARYRARQAQNKVTVTFDRSLLPTLKTLLSNPPSSLCLPPDDLDGLARAVFDAAIR